MKKYNLIVGGALVLVFVINAILAFTITNDLKSMGLDWAEAYMETVGGE